MDEIIICSKCKKQITEKEPVYFSCVKQGNKIMTNIQLCETCDGALTIATSELVKKISPKKWFQIVEKLKPYMAAMEDNAREYLRTKDER